ncbi:MAG: hypothetical protein EZS28_047813 [Streblomastix strix]|uniref:Uncharacterized protein n=1 Tax=Streblomastix strix TaxID=222440 RepID=A0A5J4TG53_9EUKA|nr:MAG: hypothetical protein EZS28_047813 [Streblomastix strix]
MDSTLDLYDGLSENAANPIVNNASSMKFFDLETCYKVSHCKGQVVKASQMYVTSKILQVHQYYGVRICYLKNV